MKLLKRCWYFFIFLLLPLSQGFSDGHLQADLVIVGPGDPLYTYWGHIGFAITDTENDRSRFYDFGNFTFYSESFYEDFFMGRMYYLAVESPTESFYNSIIEEDRDLSVYPLNLGQSEVEKLNERLQWWVEPENREYLYDYFQNNCSTIIRDILDETIDGQLKDATAGRRDRSFRHYTRTGAHGSLAWEIALHYLLGPQVDRPIDNWDLMFLPQEIVNISEKLEYVGDDGTRRILAAAPRIVNASDRKPTPTEPRTLWPLLFAAGLLLAVIWLLAGRARSRRARRFGRLGRILITLFVGFPGLLVSFFWIFTNHEASYGNINLWPAFPTVLIGLFAALPRSRKGELALSWLWTVNLAGLLLAVTLRLTGVSSQSAGAFWAFYAPICLMASRAGLMLTDMLYAGRTMRESASSAQRTEALSKASAPEITDIDL